MSRPAVIAIDGPSASGKSSTAHDVAARLGWIHLNSGLLYRALTWIALRDGWYAEDSVEKYLTNLHFTFFPDPPSYRVAVGGDLLGAELRSAEVTRRVSALSARPEVRRMVVEQLRSAAADLPLVVDGRDIGTVVFPDASLKIFLTADPRERARRRLAERREPTPAEAIDAEAARLRERDRLDSTREVAPLVRAEDAVELDTTRLTRDDVVDEIVRLYEEAEPGSG